MVLRWMSVMLHYFQDMQDIFAISIMRLSSCTCGITCRIARDVGLHLPKHSPATAAIAGFARRVASSIHLHIQ